MRQARFENADYCIGVIDPDFDDIEGAISSIRVGDRMREYLAYSDTYPPVAPPRRPAPSVPAKLKPSVPAKPKKVRASPAAPRSPEFAAGTRFWIEVNGEPVMNKAELTVINHEDGMIVFELAGEFYKEFPGNCRPVIA